MKLWNITKKDILLQLRDFRALAVLIILPLVFITIIGLSTGKLLGWKDSNRILKIVYVDNIDYENIGSHDFLVNIDKLQFPDEEIDNTDDVYDAEPEEDREKKRRIAYNLLMKSLNNIQKENGIEVGDVDYWYKKLSYIDQMRVKSNSPLETAQKMSRNGNITTIMQIGPDYFLRYSALRPSDIGDAKKGLLKDGLASLDVKLTSKNDESNTHAILEIVTLKNLLSTIAQPVICKGNAVARVMMKKGSCDQIAKELSGEKLKLEHPAPLIEVKAENPVYQEMVPGFTVMFVFFLVTLMARSFINERELGTLKRLRMAPVRPTTILLGKTLPFLIISILQTCILFLSGRFLFDMSWGKEPLLLLPIIICTSLAATSLGLLVSTIVRTDSQVSAFGNFVVIVMAGVGGCFMPLEWMPQLMQEISLATPHAWSLHAYRQLLSVETHNLTTIIQCCCVLLGFALFFFCCGAFRFRNID